ncbi:glycosyltransferase family 2 protein (plasmid) [Lactococcus cremoris]|uniref:Glycosyltransferase family 2 protein n=1 Tax=Lactococcus lactis subsp. cremoris TaxID=1359 RepID=A0AAF0P387_LACLC|nr:glycosyltransferase family 2 protein [Lactococcus cremoris]UXV62259.1 glycosyltransferase family 2 protein [Lactococcus cremoris]WMF94229.1 glycosyltransferase family 2 protein [Lactococcus cremoris]
MLISIIVPCFNEQEVIPIFFNELEKTRKKLNTDFEYIFIDDGSTDGTLDVIRSLSKEKNYVRFISFSRNFGKESALYAGLKASNGSLVTVMDADLQDPPELLPQMIELIETTDVDCVGTRRLNRKGEPPIRSLFAKTFYKLINKISDTEMIDGVRDYRLMTRQMVDSILELKEYNRFSKGIFSWVGYKTIYISYENKERTKGKSSWTFWSLFKYSIDGIINFSETPLNIASFFGVISCVFSTIAMIFIIIRYLIQGDPAVGWASIVTIILFLGGIQLLGIGILGKYISKIFLETKNRPIFIVKETEKQDF